MKYSQEYYHENYIDYVNLIIKIYNFAMVNECLKCWNIEFVEN